MTANAIARRMVHRICHCGVHARRSELADTFDARWVHLVIFLRNEDHLDRADNATSAAQLQSQVHYSFDKSISGS